MEENEIKNLFCNQLAKWDLARNNFLWLKQIKKKPFKVKDLEGYIQFNPARAVSTLAKLDKSSIEKRRCFLCETNRPKEQEGLEILSGWDLLVNPYPILPYHFTIVNRLHIPQKLDLNTGKELAERLKGFVVFFNEDGAGASVPDHLHFQAVPMEELPLIKLYNKRKTEGFNLPFRILTKESDLNASSFPMNVFLWKNDSGKIEILGIPRKCHRPKEYFLDLPERRSFSPGALDMAGVLVTPFEEDFTLISDRDVANIYSQVSFPDE